MDPKPEPEGETKSRGLITGSWQLLFQPAIMSSDSSDYRLPKDVTPTHYDLTIRTDLDASKFFGVVDINLKINEETSVIVLNASKLSTKDNFTGQAFKFKFGNQNFIQNSYRGTFRSSMEEPKPEKFSFYAQTQFQPTSARRAFPCWDEPALKATFSMNMISATDTVNLFNMPASSEESYDSTRDPSGVFTTTSAEEKGKEWKITHFETTPIMSTYIVAYANGQKNHLEMMYT
ncbi:hypothetical protein MPER_02182, partial [Moniliophthora perniciosa FA553]